MPSTSSQVTLTASLSGLELADREDAHFTGKHSKAQAMGKDVNQTQIFKDWVGCS